MTACCSSTRTSGSRAPSDTNNVAIIDRAQLPGAPYKPSLGKNLLISLIFGLGAAALAIVVLEILDDTFKSPEEVEEQLGLAVLGIIPYASGDVLTDITSSPNSPLAEAYRSFRTALQFSTDQGAPKTSWLRARARARESPPPLWPWQSILPSSG